MTETPAWLSTGFSTDLAIYTFLALLLVAEALVPHRANNGDGLRRWALHGVLLLVSRGAGWGFAILIAWITTVWTSTESGWRGWGHLVMMLLVLDLANYAMHRVNHTVRLLWRFHSLHHSDQILDAGTSFRHHPGEMVVMGITIGLLAGLAGMQPIELGVYAFVAQAVQLVAHANIAVPERLMRALSVVIITPDLHHTHHSPHVADTDSNYGEVLSIWDRLFGTLNTTPVERAVFGLEAAPTRVSAE